jgi:hypothetical protein
MYGWMGAGQAMSNIFGSGERRSSLPLQTVGWLTRVKGFYLTVARWYRG